MNETLTALAVEPTPRFRLGDTVYQPYTQSETRKWDCPDCLGSKTWTVTTPGGSEIEVACERCDTYFRSDFGSLTYDVYTPSVRKLVVSGVMIESFNPFKVEYRCDEGFQRGYTIEEEYLHDNEANALAAATIKAEEANARAAEGPQKAEQEKRSRFSHLRFVDASIKAAEGKVRDVEWKLRDLCDDVRSLIEDESVDSLNEMRKTLKKLIGDEENG